PLFCEHRRQRQERDTSIMAIAKKSLSLTPGITSEIFFLSLYMKVSKILCLRFVFVQLHMILILLIPSFGEHQKPQSELAIPIMLSVLCKKGKRDTKSVMECMYIVSLCSVLSVVR